MSDVLIIGGGVAGLSAAAALAPHATVTLIEAERQLGHHASGRSAAAFLEHYGNVTVRALNTASLPMLKNIDGVLSLRGMMLLGRPDEAERFEANRQDFALEQISVAQARQRVPILDPQSVAFAAQRDDVFDLDTDLLMQYFRARALAQGAVIHTGTTLVNAKQHEGRWTVTTNGPLLTADILINAAGAWADELAQRSGVAPLGLQPYRRSMARVALPQTYDPSDWPFLDGVDDRFYTKPDAGAMIVSPADEDPLPPQDAWADDMVLAEGIAHYEEMVTEPVTRMLSNWAGLRTFAPDRSLVIGPDQSNPTFYWLAGQGGYGFQTCCAAAELLKSQVLGRTPDLDGDVVESVHPHRFA